MLFKSLKRLVNAHQLRGRQIREIGLVHALEQGERFLVGDIVRVFLQQLFIPLGVFLHFPLCRVRQPLRVGGDVAQRLIGDCLLLGGKPLHCRGQPRIVLADAPAQPLEVSQRLGRRLPLLPSIVFFPEHIAPEVFFFLHANPFIGFQLDFQPCLFSEPANGVVELPLQIADLCLPDLLAVLSGHSFGLVRQADCFALAALCRVHHLPELGCSVRFHVNDVMSGGIGQILRDRVHAGTLALICNEIKTVSHGPRPQAVPFVAQIRADAFIHIDASASEEASGGLIGRIGVLKGNAGSIQGADHLRAVLVGDAALPEHFLRHGVNAFVERRPGAGRNGEDGGQLMAQVSLRPRGPVPASILRAALCGLRAQLLGQITRALGQLVKAAAEGILRLLLLCCPQPIAVILRNIACSYHIRKRNPIDIDRPAFIVYTADRTGSLQLDGHLEAH